MILSPSGPRRGRLRPASVPALAVLAVLAEISLLCAAGPSGPPETRRSKIVAPGLEHIEIRRGDFGVGLGPDRWIIHVLVADPARTRLVLGRAHDRIAGTETTSSMARRLGALAGVNGGYFRTDGPYKGEPGGVVIAAGKVLSEPSRRRPGLAVSNRGARTRLAVVDVALRAEVAAGRTAKRPIDGFNRPRLDGELILFTPEFGTTTLTGPNGAEAVLENGRVAAARDGRGDTAIPRGGAVLSGHGGAAAWLRDRLPPGARAEVRADVRLSPQPGFPPDFVLGGGPRLLAGGRPPAADPGVYAAGFAESRHPRTAVGVRADGRLLLVTVDGRQPEHSVGMSIAELAALIGELGAVEALNMDGGGSTTMVVGGRVVNGPSDLTGERPVGDALLLVRR
ncbi:MAG: phosphodiester glycosidase family protein [Candidatus Aminicenantes bacterium]|nr:phosphodiester glycosidase family protein [Candidatus Aminicenantes bacterium]